MLLTEAAVSVYRLEIGVWRLEIGSVLSTIAATIACGVSLQRDWRLGIGDWICSEHNCCCNSMRCQFTKRLEVGDWRLVSVYNGGVWEH